MGGGAKTLETELSTFKRWWIDGCAKAHMGHGTHTHTSISSIQKHENVKTF